jgi:hypothetical protein
MERDLGALRTRGIQSLVALGAIAVCLMVAAAVHPARASAVTCGANCDTGGSGMLCGPNGYPYCTFAYTPWRGFIPPDGGTSPTVTYGGIGNYDGTTVQVCITVRLILGSSYIAGEKHFCYSGPNGTGSTTSTNVYGDVYECCYGLQPFHTWAHSWQVWSDGHAHNDRYVASDTVWL